MGLVMCVIKSWGRTAARQRDIYRRTSLLTVLVFWGYWGNGLVQYLLVQFIFFPDKRAGSV